jgi:hypothetical protein
MKNPMIFAATTTDSRGHGLSLRDYFVAHAPPVPRWFKPEMSAPRPPDRWVSNDGRMEYNSARAAERDCGEDFSNVNNEAQRLWAAVYERERDLQWPMFWANEQLNRR